jgi:hypothetical protein
MALPLLKTVQNSMLMSKKSAAILITTLMWTMLVSSSPVQATLQLALDAGGGNTALITDNLSGDLDSTQGVVAYAGSLGNFILNVAIGSSKPALGSASDPQINLYSVDITGWHGGGTLTLLLTDTGFTSTSTTNFSIGISGSMSSGGTLLYSAFQDNSNTAFGTASSVCSLSFSTTFFSDACTNTLATDAAYSLTLATVITLPGSFSSVG